jgi:tRNA dimethylallyltransferase
VWELTGVPLTEHHERQQRVAASGEPPLRFALSWSPLLLAKHIERRVDRMLADGWVDEVRALLDDGIAEDAPAWNALGYPEIVATVRGTIGLEEAREKIVVATRRFAKRQRTWFRAAVGVEWIDVNGPGDLAGAAERIVRRVGELESPPTTRGLVRGD